MSLSLSTPTESAIIAAAAALLGVTATTFVQGRRDRWADARSLRDSRRARLTADYAILLHACVGTADLLRQVEVHARHGVKPVPDVLTHWQKQVDAIREDLNRAQIRLMLEETEPEVSTVINLSYEVARLYSELGPGTELGDIPTAVERKHVEETHNAVHERAEKVRSVARDHLARLQRPLPEPWGARANRWRGGKGSRST